LSAKGRNENRSLRRKGVHAGIVPDCGRGKKCGKEKRGVTESTIEGEREGNWAFQKCLRHNIRRGRVKKRLKGKLKSFEV